MLTSGGEGSSRGVLVTEVCSESAAEGGSVAKPDGNVQVGQSFA